MTQVQPALAEPNQLRLAPDPSAARDARAWVAGVLARWPEESVETARLLVSELVTNSVLHAGTAIAVTYRPDQTGARFEVSDGYKSGPVPKRYGPDSPTGRGLRLVALLADDWGVQREPQGKTVWFVVSPSRHAVPRLGLAPVDAGLVGDLREIAAPVGSRSHGTGATRGASEDAQSVKVEPERKTATTEALGIVDVHLLALPLDVYLEAEQHYDALVRELTFIVQAGESSRSLEGPRRLLDLATEVRMAFSQASEGLRAHVEDSLRRGQETVNVDLSLPRWGWQALLWLADRLDEVDRHCEEGELLTLASSARLRHFRAWYVLQIVDQLKALPPTPWDERTG